MAIGTKYGTDSDTSKNDTIGAKIAHPRDPQAYWCPTSPRPVLVSRVAIRIEVSSNTSAARGKISDNNRMEKYDQTVVSTSPSILTQTVSARTLAWLSYGSLKVHSKMLIQY